MQYRSGWSDNKKTIIVHMSDNNFFSDDRIFWWQSDVIYPFWRQRVHGGVIELQSKLIIIFADSFILMQLLIKCQSRVAILRDEFKFPFPTISRNSVDKSGPFRRCCMHLIEAGNILQEYSRRKVCACCFGNLTQKWLRSKHLKFQFKKLKI